MVQNCSVWFVLFHNGEGVGDDFFVDGWRLTVDCCLLLVDGWWLIDFFFFFWLDYSWVYILLEFVNLRFQKKQKVKTWSPRRSNLFLNSKWKKLASLKQLFIFRPLRLFDTRLRTLRSDEFCSKASCLGFSWWLSVVDLRNTIYDLRIRLLD